MPRFDPEHTIGFGHHVRERVRGPADGVDVLDDRVAIARDTGYAHGRQWCQADLDLRGSDPGRLLQEGAVAPDTRKDPPGKGMVVPAECGTGAAEAVMVDLDLVTVNGGEDTPAGA